MGVRPLRTVTANLVLAAVYAVVAWGSLRFFAYVNAQASPVWPPTGLALGALLVWGRRLTPGVFLGAVAANWMTAGPAAGWLSAGTVGSSFAIGAGNAAEAWVGAAIVGRFAGGRVAFDTTRNLFRFLPLALVGPLVSASVGVATLVAVGSAPAALAPVIWATWYAGDFLGAWLVTPAVVAAFTPLPHPSAGRMAEAAILAILLGATGLAIFGLEALKTGSPLGFALLPFVVWGAIRFGLRGAAGTALLVGAIRVWETLESPLAADDINLAFLYIGSSIAFTTITGLALQATLSERRRTEGELRTARDRLEARVEERTHHLVEKQEEIMESRHILEDAEATAHLGSWQWDIPTNRVTWSDETYRIFGLAQGSITVDYDSYLSRVHPEDQARVDGEVKKAYATGADFEFEHRIMRPDGSVRWALSQGHVQKGPDGKPLRMTGIVLDITERRASEARFRSLLESAPDAYVISGADGRIVLVNQQAEKAFGYTREELLRLHIEDLMPERFREHHANRRAAYLHEPRNRSMGTGLDLRARRKDGSEFPVEISLSPLQTEEGLRVVATVRDITERKKAEVDLETARKELAVREKLAALGTLVSGVGHEVRTPLTYISTNLALIRIRAEKAAAADPAFREFLGTVEKSLAAAQEGVTRIDRIVQQLRQFAKSELQPVPVGLHEVVGGAVELFRATRRGQFEVAANLTETPPVEVDKGQVQQVLLNLLNNGADAMAQGGTLEVRLRTDGPLAVIEVEDHGMGIPPEIEARLWDPFFTTKAEGTGLGLAISRRIVEAHGGSLDYATRVGQGTVFRIRLPLRAPSRPIFRQASP